MGTGVTIFIFLLFLKPCASQSTTTIKAATTSDAQSSSRTSTVTSSRLIDSSTQSKSASVATMNTSTTTSVTTLTTTTIATTTGIQTINSTTQNTLTSVANMNTSTTTTATTRTHSPTTSTTRGTTGITITETQLATEQSTIKSNSTGASTIPIQVDVTTKFPMNMSNNDTYSSIETSFAKITMLTTMTPTTILMTVMQSGEEKTTNATMSPLNTNPLSTIPNGNDPQTKIPAVTSTVSQVAPDSTNRTTTVSDTLSSKDEKKEELSYDRDLVIIFGTMLSLMLVASIGYGIFKCNRRRKNKQFMEGGGVIHIATSQF